jgi:hypothetical protein
MKECEAFVNFYTNNDFNTVCFRSYTEFSILALLSLLLESVNKKSYKLVSRTLMLLAVPIA